MRFGILPPYGADVVTDPSWMAAFARHADDVGFESIYLGEHLALPDDTAFPDALETLAFLAGHTTYVRLHTSALILPLHHPVHLAKRVATLDRLSRGRVTIGVGVGSVREEVRALGVDPATRGRRADEAITALRVLWRDNPASFAGEFYGFSEVRSHPRPVTPGGPPIHVGGHSAASATRAGRLADGFHPQGGLPFDDLDGDGGPLRVMREAARSAGRDPAAIEVTVTLPMTAVNQATIEAAERVGVTRIVLATRPADLDAVRRAMDDFAANHPMPEECLVR
ncbi:LLM class F420-dependent oxidoreductase [Spongiactinospora sp. TRM90649]|uniref:LLM class F420-dependent oxidoreductase n=1 Tax=Spongiactinospora sp. TRM90649 TaxID=3031114 RepID=UPI0023F676CC|nr:LLM class F420-dependent oxidoreductase [Spongiactinospora sp. TRM90649]MDF5752322.1 LLM class F420-dependent oxidoreductase [Spongiactinospora sp. TRM90649]